MHHFCVITPKGRAAEAELAARLEAYVHRRLTFEPEEAVLHRLEGGPFVFSAALDGGPLGIETPCHLAGDRACVVAGLPTFERFPQYEPSQTMRPAAWVDELLERYAPAELHARLGGAFAAVHVTPRRVVAFAAFSGYDSLYGLENELYTVVGNRAALVAAFQPGGPCCDVNRTTLSWIPATTMILGHETPWTGVTRVGTREVYMADERGARTTLLETSSSTPPPENELESFREAALDGLAARLRWYLATGARLEAHLTGGKDSRANLALLMATGSVERMERIVTVGSEDNGDVIVARRIAEAEEIANHVVEPGAKRSVDHVDPEDLRDWFRFSPWKYDLYLTPYDGHRHGPGDPPAGSVTLMGGGGEVVRQKGIVLDPSGDSPRAIVDRFTNWYYRLDALGLLSKEALWFQRGWLRRQVSEMIEAGVVNLQQRFYVEHRMANWGNAHFRGSSRTSLAALLDFDLARLMHVQPDMGDELPYEILKRFAPSLLGHPFLNDAWSGPTRARAERDGVLRSPLEVSQGASFPWQFALYRQGRDALVNEALAHVSLWEGIVSEESLAGLLDAPVEPFNSADAKMLFGLVAGTNYLRGDLRAEREFAGTGRALTVGGSEAGILRRWFAHRRVEGRAGPVSEATLGEAADGAERPGAAGQRSRAAEPAASLGRPGAGAGGSGAPASADLEGALDDNARLREELAEALEEHEHLIRRNEEARADARAIERSRSWRLFALALRGFGAARRRQLEPLRRLERLTRR